MCGFQLRLSIHDYHIHDDFLRGHARSLVDYAAKMRKREVNLVGIERNLMFFAIVFKSKLKKLRENLLLSSVGAFVANCQFCLDALYEHVYDDFHSGLCHLR